MHLHKNGWSRLARNAWNNRQELIAAGLTSRRDLLRLGLLTSAGYLALKHGLSSRVADAGVTSSPRTTAFVDELRIMPVKQPLSSISNLSPYPTIEPNWAGGEGRQFAHGAFVQHPGRFSALPNRVFETRIREAKGSVCSQLAEQTLWGFDGVVPGVTYHARYGEDMLVRYINDLPQAPGTNGGFGKPEVSTHLHNGHTPSESDGFPEYYYPNQNPDPGKEYLKTAKFYDHHYPNVLAGFASTHIAQGGDIRESMSTLWYHDHREHYTAQNTYKGLAGFYLLFNEKDCGDETDTRGFRLPGVRGSSFYDAVQYDVPLMLTDRVFDPVSQKLYFDLFEHDGIIGDKFLVNGVIQPFMKVKPRRYRFRFLDGGPSRFYQLYLTDRATNTAIPFWQISNDGNLLPTPIKITGLSLTVAERADVVIDFSRWAGKTLYIENRLRQGDGRGADENMGSPLALHPPGAGNFIMQFRVDSGTAEDASVDFELPENAGYRFYDLPPVDPLPRITRNFRFERFNGLWRVNGKLYEKGVVNFRVKKNTSEIWTVQNNSGGWMHPVHVHFEEFRMLRRNGRVVGPGNVEYARKDVVRLQHGEINTLQWRFRDFTGLYPMHCHNTLHEDDAMMLAWEIDEVGDNKREP